MRLLTTLAAATLAGVLATPSAWAGERGPMERAQDDFVEAARTSLDVEKALPTLKEPSRLRRLFHWVPQSKVRLRNGLIHQQTKITANVSWEEFQKRLDIEDWGSNTALFRGGTVVRYFDSRNEDSVAHWPNLMTKLKVLGVSGREVLAESETMDLTGTNVSKDVVITKGKTEQRARWRVYQAHENTVGPPLKTTERDDGSIAFKKARDGKAVEISIGSRHQLRFKRFKGPVFNALMAIPLKLYMMACAVKYKGIGEGRRPARDYDKRRIVDGRRSGRWYREGRLNHVAIQPGPGRY